MEAGMYSGKHQVLGVSALDLNSSSATCGKLLNLPEPWFFYVSWSLSKKPKEPCFIHFKGVMAERWSRERREALSVAPPEADLPLVLCWSPAIFPLALGFVSFLLLAFELFLISLYPFQSWKSSLILKQIKRAYHFWIQFKLFDQ